MQQSDYDNGWTVWGDMIKYSPAPFHRRRLILDLIGELKFSSVLDVGCGNAETLLAVKERFPSARLVGVDLSEAIVEENRKAFPDIDFFQMDVGHGAIEQEFDVVICTEVVEHVEDADAALTNLRKMCTDHLLLTVPAGPVFPIDRSVGHFRHFTAEDIGSRLQKAGFSVSQLMQWGFPFHTFYKTAINLFPGTTMKQFASREYGTGQKWVSSIVRTLFYLNLKNTRYGRQLLVRADTVDS